MSEQSYPNYVGRTGIYTAPGQQPVRCNATSSTRKGNIILIDYHQARTGTLVKGVPVFVRHFQVDESV